MPPNYPLALTFALATFATVTVAGGAACKPSSPPTSPSEAPASPPPLIVRTHEAMGTMVQVTILSRDEPRADEASKRVFAEFTRLDAMMTTWTPTSDVSRINTTAGDGKGVVVAPEVVTVVDRALQMSHASGGAFDITVGVYQGLWKFDEDNDGSIPDPALVKERLALVGFAGVLVDPVAHTVRLARARQKITLGGIAKGYAVDRGVAILREAGFHDFMIQAGGDMFASGRRGDRPWRVGIRDPRSTSDDFFAFAEVSDRTFSTSGDYERFVVVDGKRYHHILQPKTGFPATACRSVTVMAKDALTAEGLSKSLFILGPTAGMALLSKFPGTEAVVVGGDNEVTVSPGLTGKVTIIHPPTDAP